MGFREWLNNQNQKTTISATLTKTEKRSDPSTLISLELMQEIGKSVRGHHSSERVLYSDEKQHLHVGYIEKKDAAKYQSQIIKLWKESTVIPLLLRVNGGTSDKPNFGISAMAMTSAVRF